MPRDHESLSRVLYFSTAPISATLLNRRLQSALLPPELKTNEGVKAMIIARARLMVYFAAERETDEEIKIAVQGVAETFADFFREFDYFDLPVMTRNSDDKSPEVTNKLGRESPDQLENYDDTCIVLAGAQLIDTKNLSWEKILEFRKDKDSVAKLQRLKLFVFENYEGKSRSFIEDRLCTDIEAYKEVVRDWKFDTTTMSLSNILRSKTIKNAAQSLILALGLGVPNAVPIIGGGAVLLEAGNVAISIMKKRKEFLNLHRDCPLAYILEVEELDRK